MTTPRAYTEALTPPSDLTPVHASKLLGRCRSADDRGRDRPQAVRARTAGRLATDRPSAQDRDRRATEAVTASGTNLTAIPGIATVRAATILSIVGDVRRFPTPGHFAAFAGTAPLEASSGDVTRHRLSRRGDRQLNKTLHIAARTQTRRRGVGRPYYDRKIAEGKNEREALRCLKRQLSNVVYRQLHLDQRRREDAARGGHHGTNPKVA